MGGNGLDRDPHADIVHAQSPGGGGARRPVALGLQHADRQPGIVDRLGDGEHRPGQRLRALGAAMRTAQIAGALEQALRLCVSYAQQRVQFGRPIGKFQAIQHSLAARGNPWVSLHRGAVGDDETLPRDVNGIDEALLRNQYRAWADALRAGAPA